MIRPFNRRRFLAISACAAIVPGAGVTATASWRGVALGAAASITLGGMGRARAGETFTAVEAELDRLQDIFSLYRASSALVRLNRDGYLDAPPPDLLEVLNLCYALNRATNGAFDPTIQPLWRARAEIRDPEAVAMARRLVGWDGVDITEHRIAFARPGMAITLNGVAQGFITDRIAALLRARGFGNVLIDMGEIAALGRNDGTPWSARVDMPDGRVARRLTLTDRCLAVSAPLGTLPGSHGHIIEPRSDTPHAAHRLVAVSANRAAVADGLSTGCCLLSGDVAIAAVGQFTDAKLEILI